MTPNNISDEGTGRHQQHKNKAKNKYDKNPYKIIQQQLKHRKEKTNKPKDNQENKICDFKGKAPRKKAMKSIMTQISTTIPMAVPITTPMMAQMTTPTVLAMTPKSDPSNV
ncbi:hypothetical protein C2G38_2159790 [Gigaspora rosea]|uniref:Uncharacterized protein n=1 Tax=Gigaspora rosea TaxID=44941 RepID=A0A397W364_9GLOM|nr:hypothetical protein C2G38_2159790 [Gigaspora rosea]